MPKLRAYIISFIFAATANWVSISAQNNIAPKDIATEYLSVCNMDHYTIDNGLTSNYISCIEEDENGILWIGTNDGINTFDGYVFKNYISEKDDTSAVWGKDISSIKSSGRYIYAAMRNGGLIHLDLYNGKFQNTPIDDSPSNLTEYNSAYSIYTLGDYIYVAYPNIVLKIDKNNGEQSKIVLAPRKQHIGTKTDYMHIEAMPNDKYIVLLLNKTTFTLLDIDTEKTKTIQNTKGNINDICAATDSTIYLATSVGLFSYNINTQQFSQEPILKGEPVQRIIRDYNSNFWIAYANNHLAKWIPSKQKIREVQNLQFYLDPHSVVNNMYEDENQILWLATSNAGLIKLDMKRPKIRNINIAQPNIPLNYETYDIYACKSREVWAACGADGVLKIDTYNRTSEHIQVPQRNVHSIYVRRNGDVLFGTTQGALIYKPKTQTPFTPIEITDSIIASLGGQCIINFMSEDCLGNIWFATQVGLYKYNGVKTVRYPSASHGIENVNVVYADVDGRIWSGTESGSFVMEVGDSIFVDLKELGTFNNTTSFEDYGKMILISTISGIWIYNKETQTINQAPFNNQLSNTMVYDVVSNTNGDIWLSTNRGVGYVKVGSEHIYMFNHHDGLTRMGNDCHQFARYQQQLYVGNATNLNYIQMDKIQLNDVRPNAFVSNITYGQSGKETSASTISDTLFRVKYLLRASLRIEIASSDFTLPSRNEFLYRINDDEWTPLTDRNSIIISGPLPDIYRVEVRASNSDKVWTDTTRVFYIDIVPPLWFSNTAIVFYIILILVSIWFLIDIRFRTINKHMKQIENEARAKKLVEAQRNRLAKLHKDQEDSIKYAKRIQESLMPPISGFEKLFDKIFVYYMPRDIVSGDFYSIYHRDDKTFIISADCTGHGVPGAFISIVGIDHLYNIIMRQKIDDAGTILTYLHRDIHSTLIKRKSNEEFNEGMDMTLCVIHHKEKKINFAGAMNDLYIIRDNDILTYHGDRHSIGTNNILTDNTDIKYNSQMIECCNGDMFYMFSDGYVDQFGGPEHKKFKHRRLKQLLLYIHKLPANDQKSQLNRRMQEWKGANDQTDDISVIGFEPWA